MRLFLFLLFFMAFPALTFAQTPPKPAKKNISQEYFQERISEKQKKKQTIQQELNNKKRDLEDTKSTLVRIAKSIQDNEKALSNIETKTNELEKEQTALEEKLKNDSVAISKLVTALERIRRVPPQALIARPEAPLKTAQSAMLLSDIIPVLNNKAQTLKKDLERQRIISAELSDKKQAALDRSLALENEQKEVQALLSKRQALYKKTQNDYRAQEIEVQKISRKSRNLKDLVNRLDDQRKRKETRESVRQAVMKAPPAVMPPPGSPRLPISGVIKTRYHDLDKFGAKSEGIRIEGRSNAIVVAPMAGLIRFAGPFKNYDNMVIIEHESGYHSLVAGLSKVETFVGQSVNAGEPLGTLKNATNRSKPSLYYELRYKGRAVNPSKKFADLG